MTGLNSPYGLAFDPESTVYVAGFNNDRVVKLPMRGGQRTLPVAGLHAPAGLAVPQPGRATPTEGFYGAVTVRSPRRGEANASRSARVRPVSRATSAVSSAPQSMPRSR